LKQVYNGIPDWVFEEEIFEDNYALWWSPDGQKLVWGHFNDSDVEFLCSARVWKLERTGTISGLSASSISKGKRNKLFNTTQYSPPLSWITDNKISRFFKQGPML
jgi:hypothetical protein